MIDVLVISFLPYNHLSMHINQVEEWEAARMAQAVAVDVIDTSKAKREKKRANEAAAASASAPAVEEAEAEAEEEEEYVPIDAMFRDELDINTADGASVRYISLYIDKRRKRRTHAPKGTHASMPTSLGCPVPLLAHATQQPPTETKNQMRAYLVSSKLAQKFWRRKERPVVLLLTDDRGW